MKKSLVASTLDEVRRKSAEKFDKIDLPNIHLDCDGTEIDDEDYFQTLEPNTELIAVFPGEQWIDVSTFFILFLCFWIKDERKNTVNEQQCRHVTV